MGKLRESNPAEESFGQSERLRFFAGIGYRTVLVGDNRIVASVVLFISFAHFVPAAPEFALTKDPTLKSPY